MAGNFSQKAREGYITGREAGKIILEELSDAGLKRHGINYRTLFSLIRKQTPIIDNGLPGRRKRYYYKGEHVRGLCRTFIENMREIFEEEIIGRWKEHRYGTTLDPCCFQYYCSACGRPHEDFAPAYCPHCGARMEGVDHES